MGSESPSPRRMTKAPKHKSTRRWPQPRCSQIALASTAYYSVLLSFLSCSYCPPSCHVKVEPEVYRDSKARDDETDDACNGESRGASARNRIHWPICRSQAEI